jgi:hypothetical protein
MDDMQQVWDDETDGQFFRMTASCFSRSFCYGASVLLASYDPNDELASSQPLTEPGLRQKPEELFIFHPSN